MSDETGHDIVVVDSARDLGYGEVYEADPCRDLTAGVSPSVLNRNPDLIPDDLIDEFAADDASEPPVDRPRDGLDVLLDELQVAEMELSRAHARRTVLLAQAHEWAETMALSTIPIGAPEPDRREMAHRSVVAEISCARRVPQQTVAGEIDFAVMMTELPATMESLWDGTISDRHAQVIAATCMSVPSEGRTALEAELLPIAKSSTASQLKRKARAARERMHPQPIAERTREAVAQRRVELEAADDGMGWIHHYLPIVSAVGVYETVTQIAGGMRSAGEPRTMDQLRSDVLTELIDEGVDAFVTARGDEQAESSNESTDSSSQPSQSNQPSQSKKGNPHRKRRTGALRPSVFMTIPALTAMGLSDEPANLEGYGPIDPVTARRLVADAPGFYRVLTDPVSGTVLDVERKQYRPPAALRRWLRLRDVTCRFPYCGKHASHADIDHTTSWARYGKTESSNLAHFCRRDHVLKHGTSWQVVQDVGGVLHWTSPSGRCYTTAPETPVGKRAVDDVLAKLATENAEDAEDAEDAEATDRATVTATATASGTATASEPTAESASESGADSNPDDTPAPF
jgi:hypothetical protein